jgi:hypothetical protein
VLISQEKQLHMAAAGPTTPRLRLCVA